MQHPCSTEVCAQFSMVLLNIVGGVVLILFGVRFLRKGLDRLLGYRLHAWLERLASTPVRASAAGFCFGTLAPSSTTQSLLTLQLLKTGKLAPESILAFLLGANAGITVTVQLIAVRLFDWYSIPLILGIVGFQFFRSETLRGAGQTLLGLGFIFLAMSLTSAAAKAFAADPVFTSILELLASRSAMVVVFAAVMTVAAQSSTATIGLAVALADTGQVSLSLLVAVVLGANLGIGVSAFLVGTVTRESRLLAIMNLAVKGLLILACFVAYSELVAALERTPGDVTRQTANLHTAFSLAAVVLGIALARPLGLVFRRIQKAKPETDGLGTISTQLDPEALHVPAFALGNATRETLRMAEEVKTMLQNAWIALEKRNLDLAYRVQDYDDQIDQRHDAIKAYLSRLSADAMTPRDRHLQFGLLNFVSQLEAVGDIVDKTLCRMVEKQIQNPYAVPTQDERDLNEFHTRLVHRFEQAINVLTTRDRDLAAAFLRDGDALKDWCIDVQKRHYQTLQNNQDPVALEVSEWFIDVVNALRRINGLLNTIGHTFTLDGEGR